MRAAVNKTVLLFRAAGVFLLMAAGAIPLFIHCLAKTQIFVLYAFVGVGIALVMVRTVDKTIFSFDGKNFKVALFGGVALPFILIFLDPIGQYQGDSCSIKQTVTVFVHGKRGLQDMILRGKGNVIMDIGSERKKAQIDDNGEAYFHNLQKGDKVRLDIDFSEPYKSKNPDSVYTVDESGRIYLDIFLQGIDKVTGIVLDNDRPLPGVTVKIGELNTLTDAAGHFSIAIPQNQQTDKYIVWFYKTGFKIISMDAYPQSGVPMGVQMKR